MEQLRISRGMLDDLGHGVIERLLQPGFFIGVISSDEVAVDNAMLPEGQFLRWLQHNGEACTNAFLRGIFLPLRSAVDGETRQALYRISGQFGQRSGFEGQDYPTLVAEWDVLRAPVFKKIDPYGGGSSEALLRFAPDELLDWLRPFANYAQEFSGVDPRGQFAAPDEQSNEEIQGSWRISRSGRISWKSVHEIAEWISAEGRAPLQSNVWNRAQQRLEDVEPKIDAVFYYPNKGRSFEAP